MNTNAVANHAQHVKAVPLKLSGNRRNKININYFNSQIDFDTNNAQVNITVELDRNETLFLDTEEVDRYCMRVVHTSQGITSNHICAVRYGSRQEELTRLDIVPEVKGNEVVLHFVPKTIITEEEED